MKTSQTMDCPSCHGSGYECEDAADSHGEHYTRETPCEACEGAGQVPLVCSCGNPVPEGAVYCAPCLNEPARRSALDAALDEAWPMEKTVADRALDLKAVRS
jgi:hypothetical protein